jgi:hypothetical protein
MQPHVELKIGLPVQMDRWTGDKQTDERQFNKEMERK